MAWLASVAQFGYAAGLLFFSARRQREPAPPGRRPRAGRRGGLVVGAASFPGPARARGGRPGRLGPRPSSRSSLVPLIT
ncbi:hypothetical protein LV779_38315 [Streptomyces thinghirensis]|nr:hypothetical protein [Streptomyces thinghirensis]